MIKENFFLDEMLASEGSEMSKLLNGVGVIARDIALFTTNICVDINAGKDPEMVVLSKEIVSQVSELSQMVAKLQVTALYKEKMMEAEAVEVEITREMLERIGVVHHLQGKIIDLVKDINKVLDYEKDSGLRRGISLQLRDILDVELPALFLFQEKQGENDVLIGPVEVFKDFIKLAVEAADEYNRKKLESYFHEIAVKFEIKKGATGDGKGPLSGRVDDTLSADDVALKGFACKGMRLIRSETLFGKKDAPKDAPSGFKEFWNKAGWVQDPEEAFARLISKDVSYWISWMMAQKASYAACVCSIENQSEDVLRVALKIANEEKRRGYKKIIKKIRELLEKVVVK